MWSSRILMFALSTWLLAAWLTAQATPLRELPDQQLERQIREQEGRALDERKPALTELCKRKSAAARDLMATLFVSETDVDVRYQLLDAVSKLKQAEIEALLISTLHDGEVPEKLRRLCGWGLLRQGKSGKAELVVEFARGDAVVTRLTRDLVGRLKKNRNATRALQNELWRTIEVTSAAGDRVGPNRAGSDEQAANREHVYELVHACRGHAADARYKRWLVEASSHEVLSLAAEATRQLASLGHKSAVAAAKRLLVRKSLRKTNHAMARAAVAVTLLRDSHRGGLQMSLDLAGLAETAAELVAELRLETKAFRAALFTRLGKDVLAKSGGSAEAILRRRTAVAVLAVFKMDPSTEALLRAVDDSDAAVGIAAVQALLDREGKSPAIRKRLQREFASSKGRLRAELLPAMHRWREGDRKWQRSLLAEIDPSRHLACRLVALGLLASQRRLDALTDVQQLLEDERWQLRSAAIAFCRDVPHKSSIPLLIDRAFVETGRLADEVLSALESLTQRRFAKADYWQQWWDAAGGAFQLEPTRPPPPPRRTGDSGTITYHGLAVVSDRVCFVVDVSGSMKEPAGTNGARTRLEMAQRALLDVMRQLQPAVKLNVITFSGRIRSWSESLRAADAEAVHSLEQYVGAMEADGATNVCGALEKAFADPAVDTIYLLSDGDPSVGRIVDKGKLAHAIATWNRSRRVVVHTIAIGLKSNMMRRIAEQSGGSYIERR